MSRWTRAVVLVAAVLYFPGAGCDLFGTRMPDDPITGTTEWQQPTSARIIVENLKNALEGGNFGNYRQTMTEDFTFTPDAADVAAMETERPGEFVYEDWDADVETSTAEAIKASLPLTLDLEFIEETLEPFGRLRKYDYVLTLERPSGDEVYRGQAWFRIRQEPNLDWLVLNWQDVPAEVGTTWGRLKGRRRQ